MPRVHPLILPGEEWRDVEYPFENMAGIYQVSNFGRVRSLPRTVPRDPYPYEIKDVRILKPMHIRKQGSGSKRHSYITAARGDKETYRAVPIDLMVCKAFGIVHPDDGGYYEINHKDNDPANNAVDNLEWIGEKEILEILSKMETLPGEEWRPCRFPWLSWVEKYYEVSNFARVRVKGHLRDLGFLHVDHVMWNPYVWIKPIVLTPHIAKRELTGEKPPVIFVWVNKGGRARRTHHNVNMDIRLLYFYAWCEHADSYGLLEKKGRD